MRLCARLSAGHVPCVRLAHSSTVGGVAVTSGDDEGRTGVCLLLSSILHISVRALFLSQAYPQHVRALRCLWSATDCSRLFATSEGAPASAGEVQSVDFKSTAAQPLSAVFSPAQVDSR